MPNRFELPPEPPPTGIAVRFDDLSEVQLAEATKQRRHQVEREEYAVVDPKTGEVIAVYESLRVGTGAVGVVNKYESDGTIATYLKWEERLAVDEHGDVGLQWFLACPRGHKKPEDKTLEDTAIREVYEEMGIKAVDSFSLGKGDMNLSISPDMGEFFEIIVDGSAPDPSTKERHELSENRVVLVPLHLALSLDRLDMLTREALYRSYSSHLDIEGFEVFNKEDYLEKQRWKNIVGLGQIDDEDIDMVNPEAVISDQIAS